MGTTLSGTTPQDTYDSLIKVTDNGPLSGSLKVLSDGLGNDSTLSLSTTAASIAGTLSVTGNATFDSTTLVVDVTNNRIGIGTAAPLTFVSVETSGVQSTVSPIISAQGSGTTYATFSSIRDGAGDQRGLLFQTYEANVGLAEKVRISSAGNVGIGNSAPTAKLDVTGTLAASGLTTLTQSALSLRVGNATGNSGANILIAGASSTKNWSLGVQQNVGGGLEFTPTATNGATTLGITPAMVILDAGNVGIGTSAPAAKLDVAGTSANTDFRISRTVDSSVYTHITAPGGATATSTMGVNGTDVFSIDTNKYIRFAAASGGIQFNGDTAAANALDDYEEGTWTPVLRGSATAGTYEIDTVFANYTKIGRQVSVNMILNLTGSITGGGTGYAQITGLPFTKGASQQIAGTVKFGTVDFAATTRYVTAEFNSSSATSIFYFTEIYDNASPSDMPIASFGNNSQIQVSLTYFV